MLYVALESDDIRLLEALRSALQLINIKYISSLQMSKQKLQSYVRHAEACSRAISNVPEDLADLQRRVNSLS